MPAGRPRKPISIVDGHFTKEEKRKRQEAEEYYQNLERDKLVPPSELSERAREKYYEIVEQAFWLDNLSAELLANYCYSWDRWLTIADELNGQAETIEYTDADTGALLLKPNPNRRALLEYSLNMQQISAKLGLGNIDRMKLLKPEEPKKKNKFLEYIV